ncbi:MAG: segregation and condensation protein A [Betaproteobacteria bacterium RIFCSPLOWO2_02_64_14]|nr:MAG: segregation and condensation protein A [Betaproteobacteria bacterium RIFCSPLOWO2_02_64_14]
MTVSEPASTDAPVAKVYGQPLLEVPQDLYIPPDALEVFLEQFEGPLDLLLYLIRKENINVLDIPMAQLTLQYLEYVEMMRAHQLELAAEYLLMAAMLIEIKSRMLLPRPGGEPLEEDPRAELVRRLLEYEQMKQAAHQLSGLPQAGRHFALVQVLFEHGVGERLPEVRCEDLRMAWLGLVSRAAVNRHHTITREEISVRAHMSRILRRLQDARFAEFATLFSPQEGVPVLVVSLLAVLELAREGLVELTQAEAYGRIYVKLRAGQLAAIE